MYLPRVKSAIGSSLQQELIGKDDIKYLKSEFKKLESENPVIFEFINGFINKFPQRSMEVAYCGLIVYKLLRSQAESDWLEKEINL